MPIACCPNDSGKGRITLLTLLRTRTRHLKHSHSVRNKRTTLPNLGLIPV